MYNRTQKTFESESIYRLLGIIHANTLSRSLTNASGTQKSPPHNAKLL
jgi:hypothetical protein